MTEKQENDVFYVCSLIEYIARKTKNHRQDVIACFSKADIERQLRLAEVNHGLSFEQVIVFAPIANKQSAYKKARRPKPSCFFFCMGQPGLEPGTKRL